MFSTPVDRAYIIPEDMQAREKFLQLRRPWIAAASEFVTSLMALWSFSHPYHPQ